VPVSHLSVDGLAPVGTGVPPPRDLRPCTVAARSPPASSPDGSFREAGSKQCS